MFYVSSYSLATYLFCHSKRVVVPLGLRIFVHTVIVVVLCYRCPTFVARSLFFPFHHLSCMLFPASVGFNFPPPRLPARHNMSDALAYPRGRDVMQSFRSRPCRAVFYDEKFPLRRSVVVFVTPRRRRPGSIPNRLSW